MSQIREHSTTTQLDHLISLHLALSLFSIFCMPHIPPIAFCSLPVYSYLQVSLSHSGDQFASSSAVNKWSIVRKGEEATLLMIEAMLSHLIFSLYLAHLGPCDNISIDLNKPVSANAIMAEE